LGNPLAEGGLGWEREIKESPNGDGVGLCLRLALWAEVASAIADGYALDWCTAGRAGLAAAMGDAEVGVGGAGLTTGAEVGADAGSLVADGFLQDFPDCPM